MQRAEEEAVALLQHSPAQPLVLAAVAPRRLVLHVDEEESGMRGIDLGLPARRRAHRSIDLGIAGADLRRLQPLEGAQLGPLEAEIDIEEALAEPVPRRRGIRQMIERLAERARQWPHAGGGALGLAHRPEIAVRRRRQRDGAAKALSAGLAERAGG